MTDEPSNGSFAATQIDCTFDEVQALADVSLDVPKTSLTAVIGPNGCGKTTLLRVMVGLQAPDSGNVRRPTGSTRPIGYLPQQPGFRPGFTVVETLSFYAQLAGASPDRVDEVLETVGLTSVRNRRVEALSGGMTGLLGIAQALLGDPAFVVLDEPTTGLDPGIKHHIFDVIDSLTAAGTGVLLASHDLELVEAHADRVLLLETGRHRASGSISDVIDEHGVSSLEELYLELLKRDPAQIQTREEA